MKFWIAFLLFLSSIFNVNACGPWYPYGEETRFSLLYPGWFDNGGLSEFYYSADIIAESYEFSAENDQNVLDWWELIDKNVDKSSVFHVLYGLSTQEILEAKSEAFIDALKYKGKEEYIDYLVFAKTYSHLNAYNYNYWERNDSHNDSMRELAADLAIQKAVNSTEEQLKRRYAFLALRFQYYNNNKEEVLSIYQEYFQGKGTLAIDRWAEFHRLSYEDNPVKRNLRVAQLFNSVHSKRRSLWNLFDIQTPMENVLALATTNREKANVHAMYILRQQGKTFEDIQEIHRLNPENELLNFHIIREVNKLENWILGPEITAFEPVIYPHETPYDIENEIIQERIQEDRMYAHELMDWLIINQNSINHEVYTSSIATLSLITKTYSIGIEAIEKHRFESSDLKNWKDNMLILLNAHDQKKPNFKSLCIDSLTLSGEQLNNKFIFAIGRRLEFSGNLTEAILMFSHLNSDYRYDSFVWHESNGLAAYNIDFYSNVFDYFDANYSAKEVEKSWKAIYKSKYDGLGTSLKSDRYNWLDLIGTKYLREENLKKSISTWEKLPNEYWYSDARNYDDYLQANPFYSDFYSSHKPTKGDTVSYTKLEIAQELQKRIQKSKRLKGNEKAKVLFEIANCYYNMTQYGNSWMMKRYYWSIYNYNTIYADNEDFNTCFNAIDYYLRAKKAATSGDFKALCLRMAGKCEKFALRFNTNYGEYENQEVVSYGDYIYLNNEYFNQLQKEFPNDHEELMSNCFSFDRYYNSIK
ncbi:hypothetical protein [Brumimicrobium aurantiacum]|uniref:Tetratricopeptide repeat protein n=1 Tax=Brumimicrobium aurantiacum TaxID=1737063 RepID=A0A3E1F004_9FLAO|nr:hypothetical protein [Brumimicrobium aurantiacum]RFC55140.1 hypothetical protein DXU93_04785 [Brumimicrobium aurantiacum]